MTHYTLQASTSKSFTLKDGKVSNVQVIADIDTSEKSVRAIHISAQPHLLYRLVNPSSGAVVKGQKVSRKGSALLVEVDGALALELTDFFAPHSSERDAPKGDTSTASSSSVATANDASAYLLDTGTTDCSYSMVSALAPAAHANEVVLMPWQPSDSVAQCINPLAISPSESVEVGALAAVAGVGGTVGVAAAAVALAVASKGGADEIANTVIKGNIYAGPVISAGSGDLAVEAFDADGKSLGVTRAANDGSYTLTLNRSYSGPLVLKAYDADSGNNADPLYVNEATKSEEKLPTLLAVANVTGTTAVINITGLTNLAAIQAGVSETGGVMQVPDTTRIDDSNKSVSKLYLGLDSATQVFTAKVELVVDAKKQNTVGNAYGVALSALSWIEQNEGKTTHEVAQLLATDPAASSGLSDAAKTLLNNALSRVVESGQATQAQAKESLFRSTGLTAFAAVITGTSAKDLTEGNTASALSTSGKLNATDVDSSADFVEQTEVAGSNGFGKFSIAKDGAWTYTADSAHDEFAADQTYTDTLTVATADGTKKVITVSMTGTNDAPTILSDSSDVVGSITEGASLSDSGKIAFADVDLTDRPKANITAKVVTGVKADGQTALTLSAAQISDLEAAFALSAADSNGHDGIINWAYTIDESKLNFLGADEVVTAIFTVTLNDGKGASLNQDVVVTIKGTNDGPTDITLSNDTISENTDTANGVVIGALTVLDPDLGGNHNVLTVSDTDNFKIENGNLIFIGASPDYETKSTYRVTVTSTDANDGHALLKNKVFTVHVNDVNEYEVSSPLDSSTSANGVVENAAAGTTVGLQVQASDADGSNNQVTFSLVGDADGASAYVSGEFAIDSNSGTVSVAGSIDYEAGASRTLYVKAASSDGSFKVSSFVVNVEDVNEYAVSSPLDSDTSANSVAESAAAGTTVGLQVQASDADASNNEVTFSLVGDADGASAYVSGEFAIDSNSGTVSVAGSIDYEAGASRTLYVKAASSDGSFKVSSFVVNVEDVNEEPIAITLDGAKTITENVDTSNGVVIGALTVTDPDSGGNNNVLTVDDSSNFKIENGNLVFKGASPDYETKSSYKVTVTSTDGSLIKQQDFTINVINVNEAPTLTSFSGSVASVYQDSIATIGFDTLTDKGDEQDVDSAVSGFVVKAVNSGTLRIGSTEETAQAWDANSNNLIDATHYAFWQANSGEHGSALKAFTVVAKDDSLESSTPVQVEMTVLDNLPPVATMLSSGRFKNSLSVTVKSSELGVAYLVKSTDTGSINTVGDIEVLEGTHWNNQAIDSVDTDVSLSLDGLVDGTYILYTADEAGNLDRYDGQNTIVIDSSAPTAFLNAGTYTTNQEINIKSTEVGTAYLIKDGSNFNTPTDINNLDDSYFNSISINTANTDTSLSLSGLAAGTYHLYTVDAAGNLSAPSSLSVQVEIPTVTISSAFVGANIDNFDVSSNIVFTSSEAVTAVAGRQIHIINDDNTGLKNGFHDENSKHSFDIDVSDTNQVTIVGNKIILNLAYDLDLSNNYHIEIDDGAFIGQTSQIASTGISGLQAMDFSTVSPASRALTAGALIDLSSVASLSLKMDANGALVDSYKWYDLESASTYRTGDPGSIDMSTGSYALVAKDYESLAGDPDPDFGDNGIKTGNFYVAAKSFTLGDMLYIDNQENNLNLLDMTSPNPGKPGAGYERLEFSSADQGANSGGYIALNILGRSTDNPSVVADYFTQQNLYSNNQYLLNSQSIISA